MATFRATTKFDDRQIQDEELKESLKPLTDHYNALIAELSNVLNKLDFTSNFNANVQEFSFQPNTPFIVAGKTLGVVPLECTQSIEAIKTTNESQGTVVTIQASQSGTVKLLILN